MKSILKRFSLLGTILLMLSCISAYAQSIKAAGTIVDEQGLPVIGASVIVDGTTNGVITDLDGKFSINCSEKDILTISCIGYVEQKLSPEASMNIILQEDKQLLEEVVVVGYGVQKKSDITGAIASVKSNDLQSRSAGDVATLLAGKTAGAQVYSTSGAPGSSASIQVRGFSSNGTSLPLYVVDGLRTSSIADLDPNSIESIEILKDAASAAIYGAEAGNGVILVTTKKGAAAKDGKVGTITYDFSYSLENLAHQPKMMGAEDYIQYWDEAAGLGDTMRKAWDGKTDTDWSKAAFETGTLAKHNIAFSNRSDRGNTYIALSYMDNDGIALGDKDTYTRLTATINAELKVANWLTVGTNNNLSRTKSSSISTSNGSNFFTSAQIFDPITPVYETYSQLPESAQANIKSGLNYLMADSERYYSISAVQQGMEVNPLIIRDAHSSLGQNYSINGTFYANLTPIKNLTITSRVGYNLNNSYSRGWTEIYYANPNVYSNQNDVSQSNTTNFYYQIENFANYSFNINNQHNFTVMAGQSYSQSQSANVTGGAQDVKQNDSRYYYLNYATDDTVKSVGGEDGITDVKLSYYGRFNYNYRDKYFLQASLRADAADLSKLSLDKRWGYFPAVSAGWEVTKEGWFPKATPVSYLKMRASWGQNGSLAGLGSYAWRADMASSGSYPYTTANTYTTAMLPSSLGNRNLKWETSEQLDFGADLRLLSDRLSFSVDYYKKTTKDLIMTGVTPSYTAGNSASPINSGSVENKGFEFELSWKDNIGKDFNYSVAFNASTLKNKVTYIDPTIDRITNTGWGTRYWSCFEKGYPVWYLRGYVFEGIDNDGEPIFKDVDGSGTITDDDKEMIGSGIPNFTYGVTVNLSYKNFDFVMFGNGASGQEIWNVMTNYDKTGMNRMQIFYDNRWTSSNPNGTYPKASALGMADFMRSSGMVFNGSYFKIKQIQLGYSLPEKLLNTIKISRARVYASLDDYFLFTSYPGTDPTVCGSTGVDDGKYPTSKKVVFGVNLTF